MSKPTKERTSIGLSAFLGRLTARTARGGWLERIALALDLADVDTDPIQFVILTAIGTILTMAIFGLLFGIFAALIGLAVPFIVRWWIQGRITPQAARVRGAASRQSRRAHLGAPRRP